MFTHPIKVYQVEYYDIELSEWQTYEYCTNLKKAYLNNLDKLRMDLDIQVLALKKLARYEMKADELQQQESFDMLTNIR
jgi:hypothetical protein